MKRLLVFVICLALIYGCTPSAEALVTNTAPSSTETSPALPNKATATRKPSQTAIPKATATNTPPTATIQPSATAALDSMTNPGGVIIGEGSSGNLILYGQRNGSSLEKVQVVNSETFDEVATQKWIETSLSGNGPPLYAVFPDQPFASSSGETALVDIAAGSTDDPNISVGVLWTSQMNGNFPSTEVHNKQKETFSVLSGQSIIEEEGWLELGKIWLAYTSQQPSETFSFYLFYHDSEIYVLGFLPGYTTSFPAEDMKGTTPAERSGEGYTYLVKGFMGGTIYLPVNGEMMIGPLQILQVKTIERKE